MKHSMNELKDLAKKARSIVIEMIGSLGKGHIGGSLSIVDVLVILYYEQMRIDPSNSRMRNRDRLVMSKGHAGPALYAFLAMKEYFDLENITTLNQPGTILPSHCDMNLTNGVDMTTGSLGQGLSAAVGMAISSRVDKTPFNVYCVIGDGESQEGQIWEASMFASQMKLGNLIVFLDHNNLQIDGSVEDINSLSSPSERWRAFGWNTQEIDGHDLQAINEAVERAKRCQDRPNLIVAKTIKGKGWKKIEGTVKSHSMPVTKEDVAEALGGLK